MKELRANTQITIKFGPLLDQTDGVTAETGLATALDNATTGLRLSKDGGNMADRADATAPVHDELGEYDVVLGAGDVDTEGVLKISFQNAACLPHWQEYMVLSEAAWDAKYLAHPTAQAGAASSITLASGEVTATGYLNGNLVEIVSGTGAGQAPRVITSSTITTDVCGISPDWVTNPDATSKYRLIKLQQGVIEVDSNNRVDVGAFAGTAVTAGDPVALITTVDTVVDGIQTDLDNGTDGLGALAALITTLDTVADAIKVVTDQMVFTKANELDVNTKSINDATVVGDGNATPWDGA